MCSSPDHKKENPRFKISLARETRKILKDHNLRLDKRKGQHYLVDQNILNRIVDSADLTSGDTVLDIGAGIGTLTIPLSERCGKVIAIEKDNTIAAILKERLLAKNIKNVEVIVDDVLKVVLPPFNKVVSNLPYKISSPITFKLLEYDFSFAILMYQREFAERMVAEPNSSKYSRLSVMMHIYTKTKKLINVPKGAFIPPPKVSSSVIKLHPSGGPIDDFLVKTARALFQHKKKKSKKALIESFHEIDDSLEKESIKKVISGLNVDLMEKRPFQLSPECIMMISDELKDLLNSVES
jgi:16S rRNA (adenine1518-N6/adenine1519-N6)-dimethyltransferase